LYGVKPRLMKKALLVFIIFIEVFSLKAQPPKFWIEFKDKNGSPYSIATPSAFLSARAIARRTKFSISIKYNDLPPNPAYIDSVVAKGVQLLNRSGWFNAISIYAPDTTKLALIRALPFVKSAKYVMTQVKKKKIVSGKNNGFVESLNSNERLMNIDSAKYGVAYNQYHMIGVDCLNNQGYRGKGKQIAVIDTRFGRADTLTAFDSLRTRGQILGHWDFVWEKSQVYDTNNAGDDHGQEVLGCMVGNIPGQYLGDAEDADYYLLRTEDIYSEYQIEDDNWASAAEYADSAGADVITSSLGYTTFDDPNTSYTRAEMNGRFAIASQAATIASEKGMVVCVAAGNDGGDSWQYIDSPADADSILAVGAVDPSRNYAFFSSTGPTYDRRIKPDVAAQGAPAALCTPGGGVGSGNGTSFATPIMAGAVASLWGAYPNASNFTIMNAIKQSASQYSHPDSLLGYGIPNFCIAGNIILSGMEVQAPTVILNRVYPNPFNNNIIAELYSSAQQNVVVTLYNSIGQVVHQHSQAVAGGGNTLITINGLSSLPQGLYLVTVTDANGMVYTGKVVKQ
jgi:serine protease AprX